MKCKKRTVRIGDITHTEGKIIPVGGSAAITLPKSWVEEHGLKLGDTVVKVANSILTISVKRTNGGEAKH